MRILVTGSAGFIGSHLTTLLAEEGHEVVGVDIRLPDARYGVSRFCQADVRRKESLKPAIEGVECVLHLAATHFDFGHSDEEYWDTNENGAKGVVAAAREAGVKKILFYSTIAVYGDRYDESSEKTQPAPTSPYGASKLAAENVFREWAEEDPTRKVFILRPCAVYGERNIANMNNLIRQIDSGFYLQVGSGKAIKSIAYVANLVRVTVDCMAKMTPGTLVFNYTDLPLLDITKIVAIICDELGKKKPRMMIPLWLGIILSSPFTAIYRLTGKNFPVNIRRVKRMDLPTRIDARAIREFGAKQILSPEESLRRTVRYYLELKRMRKEGRVRGESSF